MKSPGIVKSLILGLILTGLGAATVHFWGKPTLDKAKASADWPTAPGTVIKSELDQSGGGGRSKKTSYSASVIYRFEVNGEQYEGDEIWAGQYGSDDRSAMQKLIRQYPIGEPVTVYYSPDDPSTAVLQPGAFASSYMPYGIGMGLVVLGGLLLLAPLFKLLLVAFASGASSSSRSGADSGKDQFTTTGSGTRTPNTLPDGSDGFDGIAES